MPHKSQRKPYQSRKTRSRQAAAQPSVARNISQAPASSVSLAAPQLKATPKVPSAVPASAETALAAAKYPYVASELKRIGILAGLILIVLVVLSFVL